MKKFGNGLLLIGGALVACALCAGAAQGQVHTGDIVLAVQQGVMKTGSGAPSAGAFSPDRGAADTERFCSQVIENGGFAGPFLP